MILCAVTGTVRGQAKKNNVSIPQKTGKSTIVTHGTIRVNNYFWETFFSKFPIQLENYIHQNTFIGLFKTKFLNVIYFCTETRTVHNILPNSSISPTERMCEHPPQVLLVCPWLLVKLGTQCLLMSGAWCPH